MRKTKKYYPLAHHLIAPIDRKCVMEVLRSDYLSLGPKTAAFEKKFSQAVGTNYACAVSSGTAGLQIAMRINNIGLGDEVITTPFSYIASANSILSVDATPVFVDIDPRTYNIDSSLVEKKITPRTKAILPVHIFAQMADMGPLMKIARKYKLAVIEDACEALGATYRGKPAGSIGGCAVFGFFGNKQITTGEGGMITTNNLKMYRRILGFRNQGRLPGGGWFDFDTFGYNYRMDEMSAALGLSQLQRLDSILKEREKIARAYTKYLAPHSNLVELPTIVSDNYPSWFLYVIRLKDKFINRDLIIKELDGEGIMTRPYFPSIHLVGFYKKRFGYKEGDFPNSELASKTCLALPLYLGLKDSDVEYISTTLLKIIRAIGK